MRLIEGLDAALALRLGEAPGDHLANRSAVAVGVFDGVHLGHLRLLGQLVEMAAALGAMPTVVTFQNHPDQVLLGKAPPLLVSVPHRLRLLRRAGVQRTVLLAFDDHCRNMTARDFAARVLVRGLGTRGLLLGYDSALGRDREGTPERFAELGRELGFRVEIGSRFELGGRPVSSTDIREAIQSGDLDRAQRYLGRFPSALGQVVHGDGRGRGLGFPTANVALENAALPPDGVYAAEALLDGEVYAAVANLGPRPTFSPDAPTASRRHLEAHILDFDADLYGREIEIAFRAHLRDIHRFPDPGALKAQIAADIAAARQLLEA